MAGFPVFMGSACTTHNHPMNTIQTSEAHAEDAPQKKQEQKEYHGRPKRRRPSDPKAEAVQFLGVALNALDATGVTTLKESRLALPLLFGRWCRNTGLRGKNKDSAWRNVLLVLDEAKKEETASAAAPTS